jgi:hypothetical protein
MHSATEAEAKQKADEEEKEKVAAEEQNKNVASEEALKMAAAEQAEKEKANDEQAAAGFVTHNIAVFRTCSCNFYSFLFFTGLNIVDSLLHF